MNNKEFLVVFLTFFFNALHFCVHIFFFFMNAFHFCCLSTRKPHETCHYTINVGIHFYFQTRCNNNTIITPILYYATNIMIIYTHQLFRPYFQIFFF